MCLVRVMFHPPYGFQGAWLHPPSRTTATARRRMPVEGTAAVEPNRGGVDVEHGPPATTSPWRRLQDGVDLLQKCASLPVGLPDDDVGLERLDERGEQPILIMFVQDPLDIRADS